MNKWTSVRRASALLGTGLVLLSALLIFVPILGSLKLSDLVWERCVQVGFYSGLLAIACGLVALGLRGVALVVIAGVETAFWFVVSVGL